MKFKYGNYTKSAKKSKRFGKEKKPLIQQNQKTYVFTEEDIMNWHRPHYIIQAVMELVLLCFAIKERCTIHIVACAVGLVSSALSALTPRMYHMWMRAALLKMASSQINGLAVCFAGINIVYDFSVSVKSGRTFSSVVWTVMTYGSVAILLRLNSLLHQHYETRNAVCFIHVVSFDVFLKMCYNLCLFV